MCEQLIAENSVLPESSFKMRRAFLCKKGSGFLAKIAAENVPAQNPLGLPGGMPSMNPAAMTDMLKNNLTMIVSSMGMFGWISYFFSGFHPRKSSFPIDSEVQRNVTKRSRNCVTWTLNM